MDDIENKLIEIKASLEKPSSKGLISTAQNISNIIGLWNPLVGFIVSTAVNNIAWGYNDKSIEKLNQRLTLIIDTILSIQKEQKSGKTNYEANIICPDLFKQVMIEEDIVRVKTQLHIIKKIFESGKIDFDTIKIALDILSNLTNNEWLILNEIKPGKQEWNKFFESKLLLHAKEENPEQLKIALLSLESKNLIKILRQNQFGDTIIKNIHFNDTTMTLELTKHGQEFLKTLK